MQMIVPQSAYGGLQDMPSPSGRLSDRIERLRQRCTEALGRDAFRDAYYFLKQHEEVCLVHCFLCFLRHVARKMTSGQARGLRRTSLYFFLFSILFQLFRSPRATIMVAI